MKKLKEHRKLIIILIVYCIFLIWSYTIPDYEIHSSFIMSSDDYVETTLRVQVNKAFFNPYLYKNIAEEHNRINPKPDKLVMDLYFFKWKYRTVVYDYDQHVKYILIDYIYVNQEE